MLSGSSGDSWAGCLSWVKPEPPSSSGEECKRALFNVVICTSRLHWWVWDYWWPQSRKNRRQSHRQAEQGKLCFGWPSLTSTFMCLLVRQFQGNAHNVWISSVGIKVIMNETGILYFSYHVFQMLRDKMCFWISFYFIYGLFFSSKERFCLKWR